MHTNSWHPERILWGSNLVFAVSTERTEFVSDPIYQRANRTENSPPLHHNKISTQSKKVLPLLMVHFSKECLQILIRENWTKAIRTMSRKRQWVDLLDKKKNEIKNLKSPWLMLALLTRYHHQKLIYCTVVRAHHYCTPICAFIRRQWMKQFSGYTLHGRSSKSLWTS